MTAVAPAAVELCMDTAGTGGCTDPPRPEFSCHPPQAAAPCISGEAQPQQISKTAGPRLRWQGPIHITTAYSPQSLHTSTHLPPPLPPLTQVLRPPPQCWAFLLGPPPSSRPSWPGTPPAPQRRQRRGRAVLGVGAQRAVRPPAPAPGSRLQGGDTGNGRRFGGQVALPMRREAEAGAAARQQQPLSWLQPRTHGCCPRR